MTTATEEIALRISLFGPMDVRVKGRPLPHLRSRKSLYILALLTLRPNRPVEREWLAGILWPDFDPAQGFANLRPALSALREALGEESERLQSPSRHALLLDLTGSAEADTIAFDAALANAAIPSLERAVALYRGPLLEGCSEDWVFQERNAREQECLRALQLIADSALSARDYTKAAHYFQRAVALAPLSDAARRGLMEALARSGDSNAALMVYREFSNLLRSDPRAAPDEKTTALYQRLRTEARQYASRVTAASPAVTAPTVTGSLPHSLTELIGREDERMEVASRLRRSRLVTLTGVGGIGKTRLAVAVAGDVVNSYEDGVWMVALEALTEPALVIPSVAQVLGVKEAAGVPLIETLTDFLRSKRSILLTLDNCEHLLDVCAQFVARLLRECAGVRILATSREPLATTGEIAWAVPALAFPDPAHLPPGQTALQRVLSGYDSVRLFIERARAIERDFAMTAGNAPALAQICAQLEGIPLAIELAAARVNVLTVEQIAARLDDHLGLLMGKSRTTLSRQQTLRAMLDWSYALLNDAERLLLHRVSVFAGGWTLEAAEEICGVEKTGETNAAAFPHTEVLDLLASLTEKSLVAFEAHGEDGKGRFRLLEMVRQYAAEKLAANGEAGRIRARHRNYFYALTLKAEPELAGGNQGIWLSRLEAERDNLRAALDSCRADEDDSVKAGLQLAGALYRFWEMHGHYSEGRAYLSETLARDDGGRTNERASALHGAGTLAYYQGDYPAARPLLEESLAIFQESGNSEGVAWSLNDLGDLIAAQGDADAARSLYEQSLAIFRELGHRQGTASLLHHLGRVVRNQGDYDRARALYHEGMTIFRELGNRQNIAWALHHLGSVAAAQGDYPAAWSLQEECLAIFREFGNRQGAAWALNELGDLARAQGNEGAGPYYEESLAIFRELGSRLGVAAALLRLGQVSAQRGNYDNAASLYEEGLAIFQQLESRQGVGWSLLGLGQVAAERRDEIVARARFGESIRLLRESGDPWGVASGLDGLATLSLARADFGAAVRFWGAAAAFRESGGNSLVFFEREKQEMSVERIRRLLGEDAFAAAWEAGRALTGEQIVATASPPAPGAAPIPNFTG